jgi:hypothetical protein
MKKNEIAICIDIKNKIERMNKIIQNNLTQIELEIHKLNEELYYMINQKGEVR